MTVTDFILSNKRHHRLTRHLTFWGLYCLLFFAQGIVGVQNPYYGSFISTMVFVPAVILASYVLIYLLRPFLQNKKYLLFLSGVAAMLLSIWVIDYLASIGYFYFTCDCDVSSVTPGARVALTSINSSHAVTASGMIFGYKMGKEWFLKQLENRQLAKQKIDHELHLQKARLYPTFLFQSMNSLYLRIQSASPDAPEIILKLSDLLSYLLYESDEEWVSLDKEVAMINNLVMLENLNQCGHVSIECQVDTSRNKMIKPLVLFPLLHDCFELVAKRKEKLHVDLQLISKGNQISMNVLVAHNKPSDDIKLNDLVTDVRRRLEYLYQENADIHIFEHPKGTHLRLNALLADGR